jgi:hypothetical protein
MNHSAFPINALLAVPRRATLQIEATFSLALHGEARQGMARRGQVRRGHQWCIKSGPDHGAAFLLRFSINALLGHYPSVREVQRAGILCRYHAGETVTGISRAMEITRKSVRK